MTKPTLTLVRGLPGSGKSTFAKTLGVFHVEADMFFQKGDSYEFDAGKLRHAHSWCQNITVSSLLAGVDVVVSNTFTTAKEMDFYFGLHYSGLCNIKVYLCNKSYGSTHDVPKETIDKMRNRFVFLPNLEELVQ